MSYPNSLLDVIDQRVGAAAQADTAVGTVVSVDTTLLRAMVTFDGSTQAVPVRMFGHVDAQAGDRVGLRRYGSEWVIEGCFARRWSQNQGFDGPAATGTTSSGSFATVPQATASFTYTKRWDDTVTRLFVATSCQASGVPTKAEFALTDGTTSYIVVPILCSLDVHRYSAAAYRRLFGHPAGTYTFTLQWRRISGTGTLQQWVDDDWISIGADEIAPT